MELFKNMNKDYKVFTHHKNTIKKLNNIEEGYELIRNHKLFHRFTNNKEKLMEIVEKIMDSDSDKSDVKLWSAYFMITEYLIIDTFNVGEITVGIIKEYTANDFYVSTIEPHLQGRYVLYKNDNPDHWVHDGSTISTTRENIERLAGLYNDFATKKYEQTTINFPTGELHFANFFSDDKLSGIPDEVKYGDNDDYSINNALGRQNTMRYMAENNNVLYGQFGNTTVHIYKANDDKILFLGYPYHYNHDTDVETLIPYPEEWEEIGEICCEMWRVEAVDNQTITEKEFDLEAYKKEWKYMDFLETKVNSGKWVFTNYYQHRSDDALFIEFGMYLFAELNRVTEE